MSHKLDLDEVDLAILRNLRENSRIHLQEISEITGIPDATIQFRLKRMMVNEVIDKFTIMANSSATGYVVTAIMLVQTDTKSTTRPKPLSPQSQRSRRSTASWGSTIFL